MRPAICGGKKRRCRRHRVRCVVALMAGGQKQRSRLQRSCAQNNKNQASRHFSFFKRRKSERSLRSCARLFSLSSPSSSSLSQADETQILADFRLLSIFDMQPLLPLVLLFWPRYCGLERRSLVVVAAVKRYANEKLSSAVDNLVNELETRRTSDTKSESSNSCALAK